MTWSRYSESEVATLTAKPQPLDDPTLRVCPGCNEHELHVYYHVFDLVDAITPRGTGWYWCAACRKYTTFVGRSLGEEFDFDDPFGKLTVGEFEAIESSGFLDRLEQMWRNGELPQHFRRRSLVQRN